MKKRHALVIPAILAFVLPLTGCSESYPGDKLKDAIRDICRKEYNINRLEVEVLGETVGVYLPMDKLFNFDFKEVLDGGKVPNLEKMFEPSPEAFDKIENVLFSISRVLLSTDRPIKFYILQATDVDKTGQQLTIKGCVDDIRRVRIWDISRGEYRRRVVSEWGYNRTAVWHKPVRKLFKDLEVLSVDNIRKKYFENEVSDDAIQDLFYHRLLGAGEKGPKTVWDFDELKSLPINKNEIVVYAKVRPDNAFGGPKAKEAADRAGAVELKYMLLVSLYDRKPKLMRVVPFQYEDSKGHLREVSIPSELRFDNEKIRWEREFKMEDIRMGPFLAEQITRRVQNRLLDDERIHNTFEDLKLDLAYSEEPGPKYFSLAVDAVLKNRNRNTEEDLQPQEEDIAYALDIAFREFVTVIRSYRFEDYQALHLNFVQEPRTWVVDREGLELFRQKKTDFQGLMTPLAAPS